MSILNALSIYSVVFPFLAGLFLYKRLSKDGYNIWLIAGIGILPQLLKNFSNNTEFIDSAYNLYLAGEFILTFQLFKKKFIYKRSHHFFLFSAFIYSVLVVVLVVANGINHRFLYEWICLNSFIYSLWIMIIILEQYKNEMSDLDIKLKSAFFWFLVGTFIYSLCTFMVFAFWNFIKNTSEDIAGLIRSIHSVFNIILYISFTVGLCFEAYFKYKKTSPEFYAT